MPLPMQYAVAATLDIDMGHLFGNEDEEFTDCSRSLTTCNLSRAQVGLLSAAVLPSDPRQPCCVQIMPR